MSRNTFSSENISWCFPLLIHSKQKQRRIALNREHILIIISLYVTTECINDQNKIHRFTSDRFKPPTVLLTVYWFSIGFQPNDENLLDKLYAMQYWLNRPTSVELRDGQLVKYIGIHQIQEIAATRQWIRRVEEDEMRNFDEK